MLTYSRDFYVHGFPLCDYSHRNKAASLGTTHSGLSLISGFGRDAPEVVSAHKRCAFYIICIHAWSESEDTICLSLVKSEQSVWKFAGEMNRIDQNGIWRELEFPQLPRADILNTRASLILSVWLRGKLGSDFLLCLSFLDWFYSYHMKSRFAFHFHVSIQSLSFRLSPGLSLQIKMFRGVSFNVTLWL